MQLTSYFTGTCSKYFSQVASWCPVDALFQEKKMISLQLGIKTCQLERLTYRNYSLINPEISLCNENQMLMLCVLLPCPKYWIKILPFLTCYYLLLSHLWLDFLELLSAVNQWSLAGFSKQNGFLVAKDKFKPMRTEQLFTTKQQPRSRQFQGRTPDCHILVLIIFQKQIHVQKAN